MNAERWGLLALIGLTGLSLVLFLDPYFESMWDAVLYVLTTRSLLAGEGYTVFGESFGLRPPGFSFLLAPVMAVFGTHDFLALNVFTSVLGIAALAGAYLLFRERLGVPLTLALCLGVWISPQYRSLCLTTLSDTAGLAALFGCLLLERRARRSPSLARDLGVAAAIAAATYLRTVAFLLIPAILLSRLLSRGREPSGAQQSVLGLVCILALPLLAQAPWSLWKAANPPPVPSELWGIHSYSTAQWHESGSNPESPRVSTADVLARIPVRTEQCLAALGSRLPKLNIPGILDSRETAQLRAANRKPGGLLLGAAALLILILRGLRRWEPGDVFALGNLATLSIYFDFDERVLMPSYLFVLAATLGALRDLVGRWLSPPRAALGIALLTAGVAAWDAREGLDRGYVKRRNRINGDLADYVESNYPADVAVGASLGHKVAVFLDRPVWFYEVMLGREGSPGAWSMWKRRELDLFLDTGVDNGRLRQRLGDFTDSLKLIHRVEDARVYDLPPHRR